MIVVANFENIFFHLVSDKFQEKSPNFKELPQKLSSLNRVNYSNQNAPTPGESCMVNSLTFGQFKVVNPTPYPGGYPKGFT